MLQANWNTVQGMDVLSLEGRFDGLGSQIFDQAVAKIPAGSSFVPIDFQEVDYLSSAGVRSLVKLEKALRKNHGGVILFALKPEVKWVLEVSGLLNHFCVLSDRSEALNRMTQSQKQQDESLSIECGGRSCLLMVTGGQKTPFEVWDSSRRGTLRGICAEDLTGVDLDDLEMAFGWAGLGGNQHQGMESLGMLVTLGKVAGLLPADGFNHPDFLVLKEAGEVLAYTYSMVGFSGEPWGICDLPEGSPISLIDLARSLVFGIEASTGQTVPLLGLAYVADLGQATGTLLKRLDRQGENRLATRDLAQSRKVAGLGLYGAPGGHSESLLNDFLSLSGELEQEKELWQSTALVLSEFTRQEDLRSPRDFSRFLPGLEVLEDVTGLDAASEVTGGRVWVFLPELVRSGTEKLVTIELMGDDPFPAEWDVIARRLYPDAGRVILDPLRGGFSNAKPFRVTSYDRQGKRMLPTVLKVGPVDQISREISAHEQYVAPYILNNATTIMGTTRYGESRGIRYNFVGISGPESKLTWLTRIYQERPTDELLDLFDTVFTQVLKPWYGQPHWEMIYPYQEHDPLPNFATLLDDAEQEFGLNRTDETLWCPELDRELPNPFRFLDQEYPARRSQSWLWYTGIIHGDLNMQNLLLDERENIYIIDFSETRLRNIVADFARLEPIFKFEMTRLEDEADLHHLVEFEQGLAGAGSLNDIPPFHYQGDDPSVEKAYRMICRIRQYAKMVVIFETDLIPYLLAMLEWTYSVMAYKGFPPLRKKLAAYSAGLIVEQIQRLSS